MLSRVTVTVITVSHWRGFCGFAGCEVCIAVGCGRRNAAECRFGIAVGGAGHGTTKATGCAFCIAVGCGRRNAAGCGLCRSVC